MPLANFYECLVRELGGDRKAEGVFQKINEDALRDLRKAYETLNEHASVEVDYSNQETRQAYFVGYFPNYIQPLARTLRKLHGLGAAPAFNGPDAAACFIGGGPGPEALGWISMLGALAPNTRKAIAHILDKYADSWSAQHNYVQKHLAHHYWDGAFEIQRHPFELGSPHYRSSDKLPDALLYVMQNCLTDQPGTDDELVERLFQLFTAMPQNSLFIIIDFQYARTFSILTTLSNRIRQSTFGTVVLDVETDTADSVVVPPLVQTTVFKGGLRARSEVTYPRVVFKRIDRTQKTASVEWPVTLLPPRDSALNAILRQQPAMLDTLQSQLAPGDRVRISPFIHRALWATCLGVEERLGQAHYLLQSPSVQQKLDRMASALKQTSSANPGHDPTSDVAEARLLGSVVARVTRLQTVLLGLLRSGQMPDSHAWWFASETPFIDAVAFIDFILALVDSSSLLGHPAPLPPLRLVLPPESENRIERAFLNRYMDITKPAYAAVLPDWFDVIEQGEQHAEGLGDWHVIIADLSDKLDPQAKVEALIHEHASDAILLASNGRHVAEWRHDFLQANAEFVPVGPCGSEFGGVLPHVCRQCSIGQSVGFHSSGLVQAFFKLIAPDSNSTVYLSYVALRRMARTAMSAPAPLALHDGDYWHAPISLRVLGTYPTPLAASQPKKGATTRDDNHDSQGSLELALCPAPAAAAKFSLKRQPGKALPRLGFGQIIDVADVQVDTISGANTISLNFTNETRIERADEFPAGSREFLPRYDESTRAAIDRLAQRWFGFPSMKPFQHAILSQTLTGKPILGIAATGGGKSECFILPALALTGITVVVSPLKSLMQDQLEQRLSARYGVESLATFINSDVPFRERELRLRRLEQGHFKLIYMTPEQLERGYILESLQRADVAVGIRYLALDEAHCISQWGHDFRSSYLNIVARLKRYNIQPVPIALTATASPNVRVDICKELGIINRPLSDGGNVLLESSNRPELNLVVRITKSAKDRSEQIAGDLRKLLAENKRTVQESHVSGAAIVFMPHTGSSYSRYASVISGQTGKPKPDEVRRSDDTEQASTGVEPFAAYLQAALNTNISIYHGQMDDRAAVAANTIDTRELESDDNPRSIRNRDRRTEQTHFISGQTAVMVATKGFGMGIDKPNIRLVIHRTAPGNLEAYVQEAGRAGRDGQRANVILYYAQEQGKRPKKGASPGVHQSDEEIQESFLSGRYIRREDVELMRNFLRSLKPHRDGYYHFTSMQAIDFFNSANYVWPEFQLEAPRANWSGDHLALRKLGQNYDARTKYIKRILDVLYRIRPDMHDRLDVPFLESVQEISTHMDIVRIDVDAIWNSTYYFGDVLRQQLETRERLKQLLPIRHALSMANLSQKFEMSIGEVQALLSDISAMELEEGSGKGRLLVVRMNTPRDPKGLAGWRGYAGVTGRERKNDADLSAKRAGREYPIDDDYFPEKQLSKPKAWEVKVGAGYVNDADYHQYLDVFMSIHDERQANDWAAYRRLLYDYIGVVERQQGKPASTGQRHCLREVMLGYLKTGEVVSGGNCRSCSVCVPDEDFDQYTDEERSQVVVRLDTHLTNTLDAIEEGCASRLPAEEQMNALLSVVRSDIAAGRSTGTYIMAWSARVAQEVLGHIGALWLRVKGSLDIGSPISPQELIENVRILADKLSAPAELKRLHATIRQIRTLHEEPVPAWALLEADVTAKLHYSDQTFAQLGWLVEDDKSDDIQYEAATRLFELTGPDAVLPDSERHKAAGWKAGQLAADWSSTRHYLSAVAAHMDGPAVFDMMEQLSEQKAAALLLEWLVRQPDQADQLMNLHRRAIRPWQHLPADDVVDFLRPLDRRMFLDDMSLVIEILEESGLKGSLSSLTQVFTGWFEDLTTQKNTSLPESAAVDDVCQLSAAYPEFWASMPTSILLKVCSFRTLEDLIQDSSGSARCFSEALFSFSSLKAEGGAEDWYWGSALRHGMSLTEMAAELLVRANLVPSATQYLSSTKLQTALASVSWVDDLDSARFLTDFADQHGQHGIASELRLRMTLHAVPPDDTAIEQAIRDVLLSGRTSVLRDHVLAEPRFAEVAIQIAATNPVDILPSLLTLGLPTQSVFTESMAERFAEQLVSMATTASPSAVTAYLKGPISQVLPGARKRAGWWLKGGVQVEQMLSTPPWAQFEWVCQLYDQQVLTASDFDDAALDVVTRNVRVKAKDWISFDQFSNNRELVRLARVGRLIEFVQELKSTISFHSSQSAGSMFSDLYKASLKGKSPERSSFAVYLVEALIKVHNFPFNYMTPVSFKLQTLCDAGWFDAAEELAVSSSSLQVNGSPAAEYVEKKEHAFQGEAASKVDAELLRRIARQLI